MFVARTLGGALPMLERQIALELALGAEGVGAANGDPAKAGEIVAEFAASLPHVRALVDTDVRAGLDGDPSAASVDEIIFSFPGVAAILRHRIAHRLYSFGAPMLARIVAEDAHSRTGIDIHPGADIGERFFIDHGTGVVIGETAVVGRNVRIYQAVTLGVGAVRNRRSDRRPAQELPPPSDRRGRRRHLRRRNASRTHCHRQGIDDRRQRLAHAQRPTRQPGDAVRKPARSCSSAGTEFELAPPRLEPCCGVLLVTNPKD